jgi:hypothetical protein
MTDEKEPVEYQDSGVMTMNGESVIIKLNDSPERMFIIKEEFFEVLRGVNYSADILSKEKRQTTLFGDPQDSVAGRCSLTKSGNGVRITLKGGRTLFTSRKRASDMARKQRETVGLSEVLK